jgi:hypothetical protein
MMSTSTFRYLVDRQPYSVYLNYHCVHIISPSVQ